MPKIEYRCECNRCLGTGIYTGMAERDGYGVVCHCCKGKGYQDQSISYKNFVSRRNIPSINTVLRCNPGIGLGGTLDFGGMPYKEWLLTGTFPPKSEMRKFTCPAWWYQSADYSKKPDWKECRSIMAFSNCKCFDNKSECWNKWDDEQEKVTK